MNNDVVTSNSNLFLAYQQSTFSTTSGLLGTTPKLHCALFFQTLASLSFYSVQRPWNKSSSFCHGSAIEILSPLIIITILLFLRKRNNQLCSVDHFYPVIAVISQCHSFQILSFQEIRKCKMSKFLHFQKRKNSKKAPTKSQRVIRREGEVNE